MSRAARARFQAFSSSLLLVMTGDDRHRQRRPMWTEWTLPSSSILASRRHTPDVRPRVERLKIYCWLVGSKRNRSFLSIATPPPSFITERWAVALLTTALFALKSWNFTAIVWPRL